MTNPCRCGWDGTGEHPCHRCGKVPGTRRLRAQDTPYSIAGAQPKVVLVETWGCNPCWTQYTTLVAGLAAGQKL